MRKNGIESLTTINSKYVWADANMIYLGFFLVHYI